MGSQEYPKTPSALRQWEQELRVPLRVTLRDTSRVADFSDNSRELADSPELKVAGQQFMGECHGDPGTRTCPEPMNEDTVPFGVRRASKI